MARFSAMFLPERSGFGLNELLGAFFIWKDMVNQPVGDVCLPAMQAEKLSDAFIELAIQSIEESQNHVQSEHN